MRLSSPDSVAQAEISLIFNLIIFLVIITIYRAIALAMADLPLFFDEAYYVEWSRSLAFGYYSKPPLIAWVIAATTSLCGDSELCVRAPALLVHPFTAYGLFLVGRHLYGLAVGRLAAILYATLPMISASSWIMSTDVLLLLFWTYGMWFLVRALEHNHWPDWLGLGICWGVGLLAKYTMVAFPLSTILYLVWFPSHRHYLRRHQLYVALLVALIIFSPNILWNIFNHLASFRHTAQNAALDRLLFHPSKFLEFIGSQIAVFGPVLGVILPAALLKLSTSEATNPDQSRVWQRQLLLTLGLPLFLAIAAEALAARANANWAAPSYLSFTLLVAAWFNRMQSRGYILKVALAVNILIMCVGYHYDVLYQAVGVKPARHFDPYARLRGWRELAERVQDLRIRHPNTGLLGDDRAILAELGYYLRPRPLLVAAWNPSGVISDHYRLSADVRQWPNGDYLFVARQTDFAAVAATFSAAQDLGTIRVATHRDLAIECRVYWVRNFLGYKVPSATLNSAP